MNLTGWDAAYLPAELPDADVVCFYGGGDALHVWSLAQINATTTRFRLPIWVRSNPTAANPVADANKFLGWLGSIGCPANVCVVLDLETAVDASYVDAFGHVMAQNTYTVLPYGSSSTIYANPKLGGYWVALPGDPVIPAGAIGVQYGQGPNGAYDLDLFDESLSLWDTAKPVEIPEGEMSDSVVLSDQTIVSHVISNGHYVEVTRKAGTQGQPSTSANTSIIDMTAAWPAELSNAS